MSDRSAEADASGHLIFDDVEALQDLGTFVARAKALDADGGIRLQARGRVLAAWVQVLPGQGLLGSGLVLGLRVMTLDGDHDVDVTVPLAALSDRLARRAATGDVSATLSLPPMTLDAPWSAITPPRAGWSPVGSIADDELLDAARKGIESVAQGTPPGAGASAVVSLRARVWGAVLPVALTEKGDRSGTDSEAAHREYAGLPAGAGLAAYALGFASPGQTSAVRAHGAWSRVSSRSGEILTR